MVSAGDLQNRYGHHEEQGKRMTPGLLIGCHVDTSTGRLHFTVNGKEVANKFQVEPGAMLFPAVFFEPTNKEVLQIELGRTKVRECACNILLVERQKGLTVSYLHKQLYPFASELIICMFFVICLCLKTGGF